VKLALAKVRRCLPHAGFRFEALLGLEHQLVDVAPEPIFARFDGLDDGVLRRAEMLGGVLVLGTIAASDVAAEATEAQVNPRVSHLQAFLAAICFGFDIANLVGVSAGFSHCASNALKARV
jgi:hypothetical protein